MGTCTYNGGPFDPDIGGPFDPNIVYDGKPSTKNQGYNKSLIFLILLVIIVIFIYYYKTIK